MNKSQLANYTRLVRHAAIHHAELPTDFLVASLTTLRRLSLRFAVLYGKRWTPSTPAETTETYQRELDSQLQNTLDTANKIAHKLGFDGILATEDTRVTYGFNLIVHSKTDPSIPFIYYFW